MRVTSKRFVLLMALLGNLPVLACATRSATEASTDGGCTSGACECAPGQTCVDSGLVDGGSAADAPPGDTASFLGRWSPLSGSGQSSCNGKVSLLPPNPSAILTIVHDTGDELTATSSGAGGCAVQLHASGETASLDGLSPTCTDGTGSLVTFNTFTFVFTPGSAGGGVATDEGAAASDADAGDDAAPWTADAGLGDASSSDDAGSDAAVDDGSPADAATSSPGSDGAAPSQDTLDWELVDTDGTCVTTLHYTLARSH